MSKKKIKLKEDERYCFKCKKVVDKYDFNAFFDICNECVENSSGH